jgi:hypothetical protein
MQGRHPVFPRTRSWNRPNRADFVIGLVDNIAATILICQRLVIMQSTFSLQIVHYGARRLANCLAHRHFFVPSAGNLHIGDKQVTKRLICIDILAASISM